MYSDGYFIPEFPESPKKENIHPNKRLNQAPRKIFPDTPQKVAPNTPHTPLKRKMNFFGNPTEDVKKLLSPKKFENSFNIIDYLKTEFCKSKVDSNNNYVCFSPTQEVKGKRRKKVIGQLFSLKQMEELYHLIKSQNKLDKEGFQSARVVQTISGELVFAFEGKPPGKSQDILRHVDMIGGRKSLAAGRAFFNEKGLINEFDNMSGGYRPSFASIVWIIVAVYLNNPNCLADVITIKRADSSGGYSDKYLIKKDDIKQFFESFNKNEIKSLQLNNLADSFPPVILDNKSERSVLQKLDLGEGSPTKGGLFSLPQEPKKKPRIPKVLKFDEGNESVSQKQLKIPDLDDLLLSSGSSGSDSEEDASILRVT